MLQVNNLCYAVNKRTNGFAIQDISFSLEEGYVMCLLGRNGSGKTTLLNMIYGMLTPDSGDVLWQGKNTLDNHYDFLSDVAYIGEKDWCFQHKNTDENADILSLLYKDFEFKLYNEYMKLFGLTDADRSKPYTELSTGQKLQFQLAFSMARKPKLMLLDEPMANLDPVIKMDLTDVLHKKVTGDNMGIIISTHLVDDISDITDYIGILENGKMKIWGDREAVFERYNSESLRELLLDAGRDD